jgi:hypothetical protein
MSRAPLVTVLAIVALLVTAGSALAATEVYRGRSSQGQKTVVKVVDGVVQSVKVPFVANCRKKGIVWGPMHVPWVNMPDGPIEQTAGSFTDSGRFRYARRGERALITMRINGRLSGNRWTGAQSASVRVRKSRFGPDFCKSRVRWSARLVTR